MNLNAEFWYDSNATNILAWHALTARTKRTYQTWIGIIKTMFQSEELKQFKQMIMVSFKWVSLNRFLQTKLSSAISVYQDIRKEHSSLTKDVNMLTMNKTGTRRDLQ